MTFKETKDSDFVVGQVWGRKGADKYLIDQVRDRMDFIETLASVKLFCAKHKNAHLKLPCTMCQGTGNTHFRPEPIIESVNL